MLVRQYPSAETLQFVAIEIEGAGARLGNHNRAALIKMLAEPAMLYRTGRKAGARQAAITAPSFELKAELIRLLLVDGDAATALAIFETLPSTPPEFADECDSWFDALGGLALEHLGYAQKPIPGLGTFLDALPASAAFKKICPEGMRAQLAVDHLLAAGRLDAAIERTRAEREAWLKAKVFEQVARAHLSVGKREQARALALEAAAALPPFDPGDLIDPNEVNRPMTAISTTMPTRNFGETGGATALRFQLVRMLAATGAVREADALARAQTPVALRAVALSAAVAGRAGIREDYDAPTLSTIDKSEM